MNKDYFLNQIDALLSDFNALQSRAQYEDLSDILRYKVEDLTDLISRAKAVVVRVVGINSEYYKDVMISNNSREHYGTKLRLIIGTVRALKNDLKNDYLKSFSDIIQSEVFSDYLEMAEHLLNEGYKDPSAVLAGSTLEVHIRELCLKNDISVEIENNKGTLVAKKADVMNTDLTRAGIYSSLYQKQVTAWLGIRNSAAHGKYIEYTLGEVSLMIQGIRQFILVTK